MSRKALHTTLIIGLLLGISPAFSMSEDQSIEVDRLLSISIEEELTPEEKFDRAKNGLDTALSLALDKVARLKTDLETREFEDGSTEKSLQTSFIEELNTFNTFYLEKREALINLASLEEVKSLAQEIKDYREMTYTPAIENIIEFSLIFNTGDFLNTANGRLRNVNTDIDKLVSLGLVDKSTFAENIVKSRALLDEANDFLARAREIIIVFPSLEVSTTTATSSAEIIMTPVAPKIIETINVEQGEEGEGLENPEVPEVLEKPTEDTLEELQPRDLLEKSLNNIKEVYKIFLEIGDVVNKTVLDFDE